MDKNNKNNNSATSVEALKAEVEALKAQLAAKEARVQRGGARVRVNLGCRLMADVVSVVDKAIEKAERVERYAEALKRGEFEGPCNDKGALPFNCPADRWNEGRIGEVLEALGGYRAVRGVLVALASGSDGLAY